MFAEEHSQRGDQQENTEQVENKVKPSYQSDTAHDHDSAHDQGANDSPHQRSMLCHRWHAKVSKNQYKNEDVIDAQRIFDKVSREKIEAGLRSFNGPNEPIKSKRYHHPQYAPLGGRTHAQFPPAALEAAEIDRYRDA